MRLWLFFIVVSQEVWGRPAGLFQSLLRNCGNIILLLSADSSILTVWPNSFRCSFRIIEVRGGCSVICHTSQLDTCWHQRILRIHQRHHWSIASILLASTFDKAQHSKPYSAEYRCCMAAAWCSVQVVISRCSYPSSALHCGWNHRDCECCSYRGLSCALGHQGKQIHRRLHSTQTQDKTILALAQCWRDPSQHN